MIYIFRQNSALDKSTAKTIDDLGLSPRGFVERMFHTRDFKPHALNELLNMGIIKYTEDGRLYLAEDKLMESGIEGRISPR